LQGGLRPPDQACLDVSTDTTTDETTSHSATPPKNGGQAAGYSHLADKTTDMTTSHLTNPAKDAGQVIGYSHSTMLSKGVA
jgi:hypothetical protein